MSNPEKQETQQVEKQLPVQPPSFWELHHQDISNLISAITKWIEWYPKEISRQNLRVTVAFVILLGMIVIIMGILTFYGKVTGEAFIFLIGALVGYIFAFLHKYLGISG
ncbi:MAG: hypothetical protein QW506_05105 [Thermoproteota archaeon]